MLICEARSAVRDGRPKVNGEALKRGGESRLVVVSSKRTLIGPALREKCNALSNIEF